jgi:Na+/alanine symporter
VQAAADLEGSPAVAVPNLISLIVLTPVVVSETRKYLG